MIAEAIITIWEKTGNVYGIAGMLGHKDEGVRKAAKQAIDELISAQPIKKEWIADRLFQRLMDFEKQRKYPEYNLVSAVLYFSLKDERGRYQYDYVQVLSAQGYSDLSITDGPWWKPGSNFVEVEAPFYVWRRHSRPERPTPPAQPAVNDDAKKGDIAPNQEIGVEGHDKTVKIFSNSLRLREELTRPWLGDFTPANGDPAQLSLFLMAHMDLLTMDLPWQQWYQEWHQWVLENKSAIKFAEQSLLTLYIVSYLSSRHSALKGIPKKWKAALQSNLSRQKTEVLVGLLKSKDPGVRKIAAEALGEKKDKTALQVLKKVGRQDPDQGCVGRHQTL